MRVYLQRYQQHDEHTPSWHRAANTVWAELVTHGAAIRREPLWSESQAVARAMMDRARHNIALLVPRLHQLGYRFSTPERVWTPPPDGVVQALDQLEERYGPLPLVLRVWLETVGSVNFAGAHPHLSRHAGLNWGNSAQIDGDPLAIDARLALERDPESHDQAQFYMVRLASASIHNAGTAAGASTSMLVPNLAFDAPLLAAHGRWSGVLFVPYLQACFDWGGFPGLRHMPISEEGRQTLDFLRHDLLPLI